MYIYTLGLIGTFAFAVFGANIAIRKKLDIFGVLVCAFITALGGGTLRSMLLGEAPFYFTNNTYILTVALGMVFAIFTYKYFQKIKKAILLIDAVGLSTFALVGAEAGARAGFGVFAITFLAIVTAVGGALIRDAVIHELPSILHEGLYATPAAFIGLMYGIFGSLQHNQVFVVSILVGGYLIRLTSIYWRTGMWRPSNTLITDLNDI